VEKFRGRRRRLREAHVFTKEVVRERGRRGERMGWDGMGKERKWKGE
jgi:hypothetical protein